MEFRIIHGNESYQRDQTFYLFSNDQETNRIRFPAETMYTTASEHFLTTNMVYINSGPESSRQLRSTNIEDLLECASHPTKLQLVFISFRS